MSKTLITLISTLLVAGTLSTAYAGDRTYNVYQNGVNVGTMSMPANRYPGVMNRMNGTSISVRPQPRPDAAARQKAAEARMNEWKRQDEQRRVAAQAQQRKWNNDFNRRHAAAQNGFDAWKAAR